MRWLPLYLLVFTACPSESPLTVGSKCSEEGVGRCDGTAPRLLQCNNGVLTVYADCHGPRGCTLVQDTADCDTSGNSVGARCPPSSEGKVRCDPDGGLNILRCVNGTLGTVLSCTPPASCVAGDGGLVCL